MYEKDIFELKNYFKEMKIITMALHQQSHILYCLACKSLIETKSLDNQTDVIHYFIEVVKIRGKLNLT